MASASGRLHGFFMGPYVTAKFALEGYMDCLRLELAQFGVSLHILEPGAFKTTLLDDAAHMQRVDSVSRMVDDLNCLQIWSRLSSEVQTEYGMQYKEDCE
jgi:NAD(P)-dependent dehydrogenase (short-subunit alcohol dehydrogenase family)